MTKIILPAGSEIETGNATFNEGNQFMKKLSTVEDIDVTVTGITTLYTVPTGKIFYPLYSVLKLKTFTAGSKSTNATYTNGTNDPNYNNVFGQQPIGGVTQTVGDICPQWYGADAFSTPFNIPKMTAGTVFKMNIDGASDADVETWDIDIWGILENA